MLRDSYFSFIFRMYDAFMGCVHDLYLPNSELCPDDHIWMSLREYSWYIRQQMAGLDPEQCRGTVLILVFLTLKEKNASENVGC